MAADFDNRASVQRGSCVSQEEEHQQLQLEGDEIYPHLFNNIDSFHSGSEPTEDERSWNHSSTDRTCMAAVLEPQLQALAVVGVPAYLKSSHCCALSEVLETDGAYLIASALVFRDKGGGLAQVGLRRRAVLD